MGFSISTAYWWAPLAGLSVLLAAPTLEARSRGISGVGCDGCHGRNENSSASLSPMTTEMGSTTTLRFTLSDPDAEVAGVFIDLEDPTQFSIPSGEQLAVISGGITHTSPRDLSGGSVTYEVTWRVPDSPGATRFVVSSVTGNDNGRNSGDEGLIEYFDVVYGCEPQTFYADYDGDGFGRETPQRVFCAGSDPAQFAQKGGDCDDNSEVIHPDAIEYCNRKDDNCNGEVDEDAVPAELYPDADGDGYYSTEERLSGDMVIGCVPYDGYADTPGDCAPDNPDANPGAEEVCDRYTDEDCDGRVDNRVRPICGVGWCRRESYSCSLDDCYPGDPVEEICNFMDDDCDDEVDEGDLCPPGEECLAGECRPAELLVPTNTGTKPGGDDGGAASGHATTQGTGNSGAGGCSHRPRAPALPHALLLLMSAGALILRTRSHRWSTALEGRLHQEHSQGQ